MIETDTVTIAKRPGPKGRYAPVAIGNQYGRWTVIKGPFDSNAQFDNNKRWLCRCECGTEREVSAYGLRRGRSKSCGCLHRERATRDFTGENNPNYAGGQYSHPDGTVFVRVPADHPSVRNQRKPYIARGRLVMEETLGRYLTSNERVFHLDGDHGNDSPDNLEIRPYRKAG